MMADQGDDTTPRILVGIAFPDIFRAQDFRATDSEDPADGP